jgi:hypothetical protein
MAGRRNYRTQGNLALKPEVESPTAPSYGKRGNVLKPDFRQKGIANSLEQPGAVLVFPNSGVSPINRLRQNENAPDSNGVNYTDGKKDGAGKAGAAKANPTGKQNPLQRLGAAIGKHKKAGIAMLSGGLLGGVLIFVAMASLGAMAIVNAGEFAAKLSATVLEATNLSRMIKNGAKALKATEAGQRVTQALNSRVSSASKLMSRGFNKALSKAGLELVEEGGKITGLAFKEGSASLRMLEKIKKGGKFLEEGAVVFKEGKAILKFQDGASIVQKLKAMESGLFAVIKGNSGALAMSLLNKSESVASMITRISGVVNKLLDFHPITKLTSIIKSKGASIANKIKTMAASFVKKKAAAVAAKAGATKAGKAAAKIVSKVAGALATAAKIGKGAFTAVTTVIKNVPGIGTALGFLASFILELVIRRMGHTSFETNLNIAASATMEFQAMASQVKAGDFPTETEYLPEDELADDETQVDGEPAQELGIFSEVNLYSETETIIGDKIPLWCSSLYEEYENYTKDTDAEDIDEAKKSELLGAVKDCLDATGEASDAIIVESSNFWSSAMVKHELGDSNYQTHASLKEAPYLVPPELVSDTYGADDGWVEDILNSAIAAVIIISPDMFEDEDGVLSPEMASPVQTGDIVAAGAKTLSNTQMLTVGGPANAEGSPEDVEITATRRQYAQNEFDAKPLLAKLFDASDYRSALSTLARNSGWNTTDSSFGNSLKNLAKTFAALPGLIASSFNKMSYVGASPASDFYGFGTVGYTQDQLDRLPDFDVAADGVLKYYDEIEHGKLKYLGIKSISDSGRVTYQEDTDAANIDVRAENKSGSLGSSSHSVTLCNDGNFVFGVDDKNCYEDKTVYLEREAKDADGNVIVDNDGNAVMETTDIVIAGYTSYTTDQMVRAYLLDYPQIMSAAAEDYRELCNDIEDATDKQACENEKAEASEYLDEAMQDMRIVNSGSGQTLLTSLNDQESATKLLQMNDAGDVAMTEWECSSQGGDVRDDIEYIANNGHAHYYDNGNCSSSDHQVTLAAGLMQFILAAANKLRENGMVLTVSSLVASHGPSDGLNHPNGNAVDFVCPSGQESQCQTLLDQVGSELGFSAQVSNENYLLDSNSTHAHFSTTGG